MQVSLLASTAYKGFARRCIDGKSDKLKTHKHDNDERQFQYQLVLLAQDADDLTSRKNVYFSKLYYVEHNKSKRESKILYATI